MRRRFTGKQGILDSEFLNGDSRRWSQPLNLQAWKVQLRLLQIWTSLKITPDHHPLNLIVILQQNTAKALCLIRALTTQRGNQDIWGSQSTRTACLLSVKQCCPWEPHLKHSSCWLLWESGMSQKWRLSSALQRSITIIITRIIIGDFQSQSDCFC